MIIACPACNTRYVVPDSAIGIEGRTVRCAKCRHSWFQEGQEGLVAAPSPVPAPPPPPPPPAPPAQEAPAIRTPEPEAPPPIAESPRTARVIASYDDTEPHFEASRSSFDHEPPFRPRRNMLRIWTYAAVVFAVVLMSAVVAVRMSGLPDWVPFSNQTFAEGQPDLQLDFPPNRIDRRTLPNGKEFFGASGRVTNVGKERRTVPPILIVLRDSQNKIVYSWDVLAPKRQLNPGESVTINEAVLDVPKSAHVAEVGWKPG